MDPPRELDQEFKTHHEDLLAECRIVKLALTNIEEFLHEHADECAPRLRLGTGNCDLGFLRGAFAMPAT
ncbi:MAG: hypothetical protein ACYTEG_06560 [Planctomycetota bacterium]